ncbi:MAG: hypothetical protein HKO55_01470, partial [Gammaproteobacteria bacterium]|nr:hypothetical protein [Gammaproteobacteria bacterium]
FSGFGLRTGLDGELALRLIPGRPPQGRGLITLESGRFQAYGQNLVIDNGTLLFTGNLEDPTLDVEAVREFDDVKVGIRLSGTGREPVSNIFSQPVMAESDALSYLVIGRPLADATAAEGRSIQNSALLLGAARAAGITNQVGQRVGLDELQLDTNNVDTGAIMAGKQIRPDLYIRYSYGLFSRLGALLLRYRLNNRISLEARSGEDQSLDLIYTRESN